MEPTVELIPVAPTLLASVRRRVRWGDLGKELPALLAIVWKFLETAPVRAAGHNVAVYHAPGPDGVEVEAGVQVSGTFLPAGDVGCSSTPSGRAAHVVHRGPYQRLGEAHDAVAAFCDGRGFAPGVHWEVYGDWTDDPAQLVTDVYRAVP